VSVDKVKYLGLFLCVAVQAGCGTYKPMEFPNQSGEKTGPGLFTGDRGAFEADVDLQNKSLEIKKDDAVEDKKK